MTYIPYSGIGSRDVPDNIVTIIHKMAKSLADADFTLRSGGAVGCDTAFDEAAYDTIEHKEIYKPFGLHRKSIPWIKVLKSPEAMKIANDHHPLDVREMPVNKAKYLCRNPYTILGEDLKTPSKFVLYWMPLDKETGGTAHSLRIAKTFRVPIFMVPDKMKEAHELVEFLTHKYSKDD